MSRTLDAAVITELSKAQIQVALLAELDFASGVVRAWNGIGNLVFDGDTYTGVGYLGEIAPITESGQSVRANGITMQLSGIPSALLSLALAENYQGRSATIWLGFFSSAWALIDCVRLFAGRMDVMQIDEGAESSTIIVTAENHLADLKRARIRRYTHDDQQAFYPGDMGLEFIDSIQNVDIVWGPGSGTGTYSQIPTISSGVSGGGGSGSGGYYSESGGSGGLGDQGAPDNNGPGANTGSNAEGNAAV